MCVAKTPLRTLFSTGPPLFEGGRVWAVLVVIIECLLHREHILKSSWNIDSMLEV